MSTRNNQSYRSRHTNIYPSHEQRRLGNAGMVRADTLYAYVNHQHADGYRKGRTDIVEEVYLIFACE